MRYRIAINASRGAPQAVQRDTMDCMDEEYIRGRRVAFF